MRNLHFIKTVNSLFICALVIILGCDIISTKAQKENNQAKFIPLEKNWQEKRKNEAYEAPSSFGCMVSTLNSNDAEYAYRYQGFYIDFPDKVVKKAKGKTIEQGFVLHNEGAKERTPEFLNTKGVVRNVVCKIPDTPEAIEILEKEIAKFDTNSWVKDTYRPKEEGNNAGMAKTKSGEYVYECTFEVTKKIILYPGQPNQRTIYFYDLSCTMVYQEGDGGGGFGGGGGDTGGGDEPGSGCENPWDICTDDGTGGAQGPADVEAFKGDIIIDASILNNDKARCVLQNLFNGKVLKETIVHFAEKSVDIDLTLELADLGPASGTDNGDLISSNLSNNFRLRLNENRISNRKPIEIAGTYLHESIHAEMRRFLYDTPNSSSLPGFPGDFTADWNLYLQQFYNTSESGLSDAEHEVMANKYRNLIVSGLKEYGDSNLTNSDLEAIAWIGLQETHYYNNVLTGAQRTSIENNIDNAKNKASETCN